MATQYYSYFWIYRLIFWKLEEPPYHLSDPPPTLIYSRRCTDTKISKDNVPIVIGTYQPISKLKKMK